MDGENPTATSGASISERIERFLAPEPQPEQETAPPKDATGDPEPQQAPETAEQPANDAQAEDDGPQISTSDLAAYLGIDEAQLDVDDTGALNIKTKIDGKEGTAKLADLVKSYQLQGHVDAKAREAAEKARELDERVKYVEQATQQRMQQVEQMANIAQAELMHEFNSVDWQSLASSDPAEYVRLQAQFQARAGRIKQMADAVEQHRAQTEQAQQQKFQQSLQAAAQRIAADVQGWQPGNEVDVALTKYAKDAGFTDTAQIMAAYPQAAGIIWKAMQYDAGKAKVAVAEKQVRAAPKLVKPGQSVDAKQRADDSARSLKEQIRKSGGRNGIAEYLLATGRA